ncbi:MAG TPA: BON domain-containing protein [Longimicrobiales bacterium]
MPEDRESRDVRRGAVSAAGEWMGRGEYGAAYEAPYRAGFHGYGLGYRGGALRSRGSYEAGQLRSGLNPVDEFEFEWGGGYVGGRGYGGTNYDYEHGYQVGAPARHVPRMGGPPPRLRRPTSPATRGGYAWSEEVRARVEPQGPARYGYGPYHHRLRRRRRSDDQIRSDVEETLFYDTWVDADRIHVDVEDGVVTLSGTLPSYDEIRFATDDAWDVDGVRGVRTELTVETPGRAAAGREGAGLAEGAAEAAGGGTRGAAEAPRGAEAGATAGRGGAAGRTTRSRMAGRATTGRAAAGRKTAAGRKAATGRKAAGRKTTGKASGRKAGARKAADGGTAAVDALDRPAGGAPVEPVPAAPGRRATAADARPAGPDAPDATND